MDDDAWSDHVADLLFDGESVLAEATVGDGRLVVTSYRLLAYAPDAEPRFQQVDRPNVTGVGVETAGRTDLLRRAVRPTGWGLLLLVAGSLVSFDALLAPVETPAGTGLGGVAGTIGALQATLAALDDVLVAAGGILVAAGLALSALYFRSRARELVVSISGGRDLRLPAGDVDPATVDRVREAIRPGPTGGGDGGAGTATAGPVDGDAAEPEHLRSGDGEATESK